MAGNRMNAALLLSALMILLSFSSFPLNNSFDSGGEKSNDNNYSSIDDLIRETKRHNQVELNEEQGIALHAAGLRTATTTWANAGGSENNDAIYEMSYDSQGNIIICGSIFVDSQFGSIQVNTEGLGDILVASLSPNGTWLWAVSAGTATAWDECRGIAIDKDDNVYASGYILGEVSFGENYTLIPNVFDGYVARVNSTTGQWDWAMKYGGFDVDVGWDILVDDDLNIYVTGYYQNQTDFGEHSLGASQPSEDPRFFIAKYNWTMNDWDWAKSSSGSGLSSAFQMTFDQNGDIYVVGYNAGSETWNGTFTSNHASTYAGIVVKYDRDGNLKWGRSYGGSSSFGVYTGIYFNNVVVDSQNRVILGGNILENGQVGPKNYYTVGIWDVLIVRLQSDGTLDWSTIAGGPYDDRLQALAVMPNDQVVAGGHMLEWMEMGNNINISSITPQHHDAFVGQIDNSGYWVWGNSFGGNANDSTEALLTTADGYHVAAGYFSGTYTFGSIQHYATDEDIFVWKFEWDEDSDGVRDYIDNCRTIANSNQSDWDADGQGDACESDDDNDLLHDAIDDCQKGYIGWNSSNSSLDHDEDGCHDFEEDLDDDNDGIFDILDSCATGKVDWTSSTENDQDGDGCYDDDEDIDDDNDGWNDTVDNCPLSSNVGQENYDGDATGDDCDFDDDNDGITDNYDNCPMNDMNWTSDGSTDNDGDGCADATEDDDDDNDGMLDEYDSCPSGMIGWNVSSATDHDWDGCLNTIEDNDDDNDTVVNGFDDCPQGTTNWTNNGIIDNDVDGCHDESEDPDDDNDGTPDNVDDCPTNAGGSYLGQLKGCADDDEDGWGDYSDAFPFDGTQWDDGDEDTFGDNPFGTRPDACPLIAGNSTEDRFGCIDTDGDGYSDPDEDWTTADGADAMPLIFDQQVDSDGDGYGDKRFSDRGGDAEMYDDCIGLGGDSTIDRFGCLDTDGDGYSDPGNGWSTSDGADAFQYEPSQWRDTDGDGYGDNWDNSTWNASRLDFEIGLFVADAYKPDLCPDSAYEYAQSFGCSPAEMPLLSDPSITTDDDDDDVLGSGQSEGNSDSTTLLIVIAGVIVAALTGTILLLFKKQNTGGKSKGKSKKYVDPPESADSELEISEDEGEDEDGPRTVPSWEELPPGGEYLDPDESGHVWYKDSDGEHWYQNPDKSWTIYEN